MSDDNQQAEANIKSQIKDYRQLQKVADDEAFKTFFDNQLKLVADKLVWMISTGKEGDNINSWNDFCKARGEIVARLQPIQEVYGAEAMVNFLTQQLNQYYRNQT